MEKFRYFRPAPMSLRSKVAAPLPPSCRMSVPEPDTWPVMTEPGASVREFPEPAKMTKPSILPELTIEEDAVPKASTSPEMVPKLVRLRVPNASILCWVPEMLPELELVTIRLEKEWTPRPPDPVDETEPVLLKIAL